MSNDSPESKQLFLLNLNSGIILDIASKPKDRYLTQNQENVPEIDQSIQLNSLGRRMPKTKCSNCLVPISNSNIGRHTALCTIGLSPMAHKNKLQKNISRNSEFSSSINSDQSLIIDKIPCPLCKDYFRKRLKYL